MSGARQAGCAIWMGLAAFQDCSHESAKDRIFPSPDAKPAPRSSPSNLSLTVFSAPSSLDSSTSHPLRS